MPTNELRTVDERLVLEKICKVPKALAGVTFVNILLK